MHVRPGPECCVRLAVRACVFAYAYVLRTKQARGSFIWFGWLDGCTAWLPHSSSEYVYARTHTHETEYGQREADCGPSTKIKSWEL